MKKIIFLFAIVATALTTSCKKNKDAPVPPDLSFETGGNYTAAARTINHGDSILVGVRIHKREDDLYMLNTSYAYDSSWSTNDWTPGTHAMTPAEYVSYGNDYWLVTRNQAGTEKWTFKVSDRVGNLVLRSITLTVQ